MRSAVTIGGAYVLGGLVPYMALSAVPPALRASVAVPLVAPLVFGMVKGRFTGLAPLRSGLQMLLTGGVAATAAFAIARAIA